MTLPWKYYLKLFSVNCFHDQQNVTIFKTNIFIRAEVCNLYKKFLTDVLRLIKGCLSGTVAETMRVTTVGQSWMSILKSTSRIDSFFNFLLFKFFVNSELRKVVSIRYLTLIYLNLQYFISRVHITQI